MSQSLCVICSQIRTKSCDFNLIFGQGKFKVHTELQSLELSVDVQNKTHICQALTLAKEEKGTYRYLGFYELVVV